MNVGLWLILITIAVIAIAIIGLFIWLMSVGPGEESRSGRVAERLGLAWKANFFRGGCFEGRIGRATVRVYDWPGRHTREQREAIGIEVPLDRPIGVSFHAENALGLGMMVSGEDVTTGDGAFDAAVRLKGTDEARALATADATLRDLIRTAVGSFDARCNGARLRAMIRSSADAEEAAKALIHIAERLSRLRETPEALAANARRDPVAGVRLENLVRLRDVHGSWEGTAATLLAIAQADPEGAVRLEAARSLQVDAATPLLAAIATDEAAPADVRAAALREALVHLPPDAAREAVVRCVDMRAPALCLVALRHCEELGWRPPDPEKTLLIATEGWERPIRAAALRLLDASDPASEAALYEALASRDPEAQRAAALAIGETGTTAAVERLLPLAQGVLTDGAVREAAARAISQLQEGAREAAGGLALAESDDAGRLSLDPDHRGAVSVTRRPHKKTT